VPERIHKVLANHGMASRRGAEQLIREGRVMVNGVPAEIGQSVSETDKIFVNGVALPKRTAESMVYMVHKPKGVVVSSVSQTNEPIITSLVPAEPLVQPVGRLDKESEGLMILTNNGQLALALTHPRFGHRKTYVVDARVKNDQALDTEKITKQLLKGVKLGDGVAKALAVKILRSHEQTIQIELVVEEGRHHLVRRMCAVVGLRVDRLVRTAIGPLTIRGLSRGTYRRIPEKVWQSLIKSEAK